MSSPRLHLYFALGTIARWSAPMRSARKSAGLARRPGTDFKWRTCRLGFCSAVGTSGLERPCLHPNPCQTGLFSGSAFPNEDSGEPPGGEGGARRLLHMAGRGGNAAVKSRTVGMVLRGSLEAYSFEGVTVLMRSSSGMFPLGISRSGISLSASPPAALMPAMRPKVRQRPWFVPGQMVG